MLRRHLVGVDGPPLEQAQLDALDILAAEPSGWRMSELADALRIDPSSATRAVDRLERVGLAARVADEDDRRVVTAKATPAGQRLVARVGKLRRVGLERLLADFDPDERERFAELLERFVEAVDDLVRELKELDALSPSPARGAATPPAARR